MMFGSAEGKRRLQGQWVCLSTRVTHKVYWTRHQSQLKDDNQSTNCQCVGGHLPVSNGSQDRFARVFAVGGLVLSDMSERWWREQTKTSLLLIERERQHIGETIPLPPLNQLLWRMKRRCQNSRETVRQNKSQGGNLTCLVCHLHTDATKCFDKRRQGRICFKGLTCFSASHLMPVRQRCYVFCFTLNSNLGAV